MDKAKKGVEVPVIDNYKVSASSIKRLEKKILADQNKYNELKVGLLSGEAKYDQAREKSEKDTMEDLQRTIKNNQEILLKIRLALK